MYASVIQIGNDKGVVLHKMLIDKYNITDAVELISESEFIILKPKTKPRAGWEELFKEMHQNGDDSMLIDEVFEVENFG